MIGRAAHGSMGGRAARPIAAESGAYGSMGGRAARPIAADGAAGKGLPALPGDGAELPQRKALNHRGPLSIDVSGAWYFITICADGHQAWCVDDGMGGRAARPLAAVADDLFSTVRHYVKIGKWRIALFLVMPDHLHFIVHVPCVGGDESGGQGSARPTGDESGGQGSARPTGLESVVADFKHAVARRCGLKFQRDFWDTRLRDDVHYAEKFNYICNNPVRKGLCRVAREWPHVIAFDRGSGEERQHR